MRTFNLDLTCEGKYAVFVFLSLSYFTYFAKPWLHPFLCNDIILFFFKAEQDSMEGGREMAQLVKRLSCKNEDLSLDAQLLRKKPGMVDHICNFSTGEVEAGEHLELLADSYPWQIDTLQVQ